VCFRFTEVALEPKHDSNKRQAFNMIMNEVARLG
jgi:hypothetical protein